MRTSLVATVTAAVVVLVGLAPVAAAETPMAADPTALVDTFLGTGNGGQTVGEVDMFPGATMPFGMLSWSPETPSRPAGGGYNYGDSSTLGLSLTHLSGVGCKIEGDLPILPTIGALDANPAATTEPFSHADETARPGYFATKLGEIGTQVAATTRTGIGRFDFPSTDQANLLFKVGSSQNGSFSPVIDVDGDRGVAGSVASGRFCGHQQQQPVPLYFAATFSRPFSAHGAWGGANPGEWVRFDATQDASVLVKVAISYVSVANAKANLQAEDPGWDLDAVANAAHDTWRDMLSQTQVGGGTHTEQVQFYTALYHSLLDPTVFSDVNGQYPGFDRKIHTVARGKAQYANFSGWDIYRSEVPLLAWLAPEQTSQMMQSLVNDAQQGGWLPKWPVGNEYTGVMNGDAADPIIAEAYAFGARDFDVNAALAAMVKGATAVPTPDQLGQGWFEERPGSADYQRLGYVPNVAASSTSAVPNGASSTLEYAIADFAISQFAKSLGRGDVQRQFAQRSQNWTSLFNVDSGFLQPRDAQGNFPTSNPATAGLGFFGQSGFQEGNAAQYAWAVPQNLAGLIAAMGGNAAADRRLDQFFTMLNAGPNEPYYWAGNETDLLAPWIYDYAGQPYRTQSIVHQLLTKVYSDTPGGEPGNDDLGAMSSWYVWSAMGMYPVTPGAPALALSSPLFSTVRVHGVTITAPGVSDTNYYVQRLKVNGHESTSDWLPASAIMGHTTVDYAVGAQPNTHWAAKLSDAPPSYPAGKAKFPTGVTPVDVATAPASLRVAAGAQTQATVTFTIAAGSQVQRPLPTSVTWTATPPAGVTITLATATVPVSADGKATATVTVSAASDVVQGFDEIPFALHSHAVPTLPSVAVDAAVIGPGQTAALCTTLAATNVNAGVSQNEQGGDGVTAAVDGGRRTVEVVPGDLNMYFQLDPRIAFNQKTSTTFTINYLDEGTDSWSLQYDAFGGSAYVKALGVTNQGTNTWKTVSVTVPDSAFGNRENGHSDFRIAGPSPLTVHSVRVAVTGPGVLPINLCGDGTD